MRQALYFKGWWSNLSSPAFLRKRKFIKKSEFLNNGIAS